MIELAYRAVERWIAGFSPRLQPQQPAQDAAIPAGSLFICARSQHCNFSGWLFDFIFLLK